METAGRFVDDETLRAALKENGIGRPSSRAGIIETLFKRNYIRRERKNLVATPTGIDLIDIIREELLKSCELTGIWEKKLRDIEHRRYDATQFIAELKQQAADIVMQVLNDNSNRRVSILSETDAAKPATKRKAKPKTEVKKPLATKQQKSSVSPAAASIIREGDTCPMCGQGVVIRGRTALGCSRWKEGCTFRQTFETE